MKSLGHMAKSAFTPVKNLVRSIGTAMASRAPTRARSAASAPKVGASQSQLEEIKEAKIESAATSSSASSTSSSRRSPRFKLEKWRDKRQQRLREESAAAANSREEQVNQVGMLMARIQTTSNQEAKDDQNMEWDMLDKHLDESTPSKKFSVR